MSHRSLSITLLSLVLASSVPLAAQHVPQTIPSLTEPGGSLTIRDRSPQTGLVTFASAEGRGLLLNVSPGAPAETRARSFVDVYGKWFGIADASHVRMLRASAADELGVEHVRMQQLDRGIPVRGGQIVVHLKGSRVVGANGHATNDRPAGIVPAIEAGHAATAARQVIEKSGTGFTSATYTQPQLEIFNLGLLSAPGTHPSRLAWFIEANGPALRDHIWIDAQSGELLLAYSQLPTALSRTIYTSNHTASLPGSLLRTEGGAATGDTDADNAYTYAGIVYDYYFTDHGRDSYDDAGSTIVSSVHYCEPPPSCPVYGNAFWSSQFQQMAYGDGYASADDVVGHELTHAVTDNTADLFYYMQSGALNESYSDIFGETIDLLDGVGNDAPGVRWKVGEDLSIGAIRDMSNPNLFGDPARMGDSSFFYCAIGDGGGVHTNSGIPNHAYALMVDGGSYNGQTVTGIGLTKAAKIEYRALTAYLTSGSGFLDNYIALNQSCTDLIGVAGITAGDCTEVNEALLAVEMNALWACPGAVAAPALCPSGIPSFLQFDGFEVSLGNWAATTTGAGTWDQAIGAAKEGILSAYGTNVATVSDHRLTMTGPVAIPASGRMYFDHLFKFENSTTAYDGGVLEYSTNGGSNWNDAGGLIDAGMNYNAVVSAQFSNPIGGRSAFAHRSFGYTGTRLSLASLSGQNALFRFRIGTDVSIADTGWVVDNVSLYTCVSSSFTDDPLVATATTVKKVHVTELRSRIDSLRIRNGLPAFSWTNPTLTVASTPVKAVHITELRTALGEAYTAAGATPPSYTDPGLATGTTVKAVHVTELRQAVVALE